jgi:hypothetical protein
MVRIHCLMAMIVYLAQAASTRFKWDCQKGDMITHTVCELLGQGLLRWRLLPRRI